MIRALQEYFQEILSKKKKVINYVIKEFQQAGIKVPEEMSVMGFDNIVVADLVTPELTTMDISWERIAELSVKRLMEKMKGDECREL